MTPKNAVRLLCEMCWADPEYRGVIGEKPDDFSGIGLSEFEGFPEIQIRTCGLCSDAIPLDTFLFDKELHKAGCRRKYGTKKNTTNYELSRIPHMWIEHLKETALSDDRLAYCAQVYLDAEK